MSAQGELRGAMAIAADTGVGGSPVARSNGDSYTWHDLNMKHLRRGTVLSQTAADAMRDCPVASDPPYVN